MMSDDGVSNDDALIDCIVYANEQRMIGKDAPFVFGKRRVMDAPDPDACDCSISMCGNGEVDGRESRLLRYCPNGHCMHDACIENLFMAAETMSVTCCPQCRSDIAREKALEMSPMSEEAFDRLYSPYARMEEFLESEFSAFGRADVLLRTVISRVEEMERTMK